MASGRALRIHEETGRQVCIVDRAGRPREHELWRGLPFLSPKLGKGIETLVDCPGHRLYLHRRGDQTFNLYHRPERGRIEFSEAEIGRGVKLLERLGPYILVDPHVKGTVSADNKSWPFERWQAVVDSLPGVPLVQPMYGRPALEGVTEVTASFREACVYILFATAVLTSEGGYHHAAAALGTSAVVLWGGFTSPSFLGYPEHCNLQHPDYGSRCAMFSRCLHCERCMRKITVDEVSAAAQDIYTEEANDRSGAKNPQYGTAENRYRGWSLPRRRVGDSAPGLGGG